MIVINGCSSFMGKSDIKNLKTLYKLNPNTLFLVAKGDKNLLIKHLIKNVGEFLW